MAILTTTTTIILRNPVLLLPSKRRRRKKKRRTNPWMPPPRIPTPPINREIATTMAVLLSMAMTKFSVIAAVNRPSPLHQAPALHSAPEMI